MTAPVLGSVRIFGPELRKVVGEATTRSRERDSDALRVRGARRAHGSPSAVGSAYGAPAARGFTCGVQDFLTDQAPKPSAEAVSSPTTAADSQSRWRSEVCESTQAEDGEQAVNQAARVTVCGRLRFSMHQSLTCESAA